MIKSYHLLEKLNRRYEQEALYDLSYEAALLLFAALWSEALELGIDTREDWLADLEPDLAVARALNGLPPSP